MLLIRYGDKNIRYLLHWCRFFHKSVSQSPQEGRCRSWWCPEWPKRVDKISICSVTWAEGLKFLTTAVIFTAAMAQFWICIILTTTRVFVILNFKRKIHRGWGRSKGGTGDGDMRCWNTKSGEGREMKCQWGVKSRRKEVIRDEEKKWKESHHKNISRVKVEIGGMCRC